MKSRARFLIIISISLLSTLANAQVAETGDAKNGGIFIYREIVEAYWNDWTAYLLMDKTTLKKTRQAHITITGEGKTVSFVGNMSINCQNGKYFWQSGHNFSTILSSEREIERLIPLQVIQNTITLFCY